MLNVIRERKPNYASSANALRAVVIVLNDKLYMSVCIPHCGTQTRIFLHENNDVVVITNEDTDVRFRLTTDEES